jgi:acetolactate decarboxylase
MNSVERNTETKSEKVCRADHTLYQVALFQSVAQGEYYGAISVGEFKQHGDFGMGIFESVNGELIMLDGIVYQALFDGTVAVPSDDYMIPYGNAAFFEADIDGGSISAASVSELEQLLNKKIIEKHGRNQFYFAKIHGDFPYVAVRSELKQEKPFKMLNIALKTDQRKYEYANIMGTIVGLFCPAYMNSMNAPGWHFHFISDDKTKGGHMTEAALKDCQLQVHKMSRFIAEMPDSETFNSKNLGLDVMSAIREAEKGDF